MPILFFHSNTHCISGSSQHLPSPPPSPTDLQDTAAGMKAACVSMELGIELSVWHGSKADGRSFCACWRCAHNMAARCANDLPDTNMYSAAQRIVTPQAPSRRAKMPRSFLVRAAEKIHDVCM